MSSAAGRRVVSAGHPSAERRTSDEGLSGVDVGALARVFGMPAHALSDQRAAPTGPRLPAAFEVCWVGNAGARGPHGARSDHAGP